MGSGVPAMADTLIPLSSLTPRRGVGGRTLEGVGAWMCVEGPHAEIVLHSARLDTTQMPG